MRLFVVLFVLLLCGPAVAQSSVVRSGDHDTFSRLVIPVEPGTTWQIEPEDGGLRLALAGIDDRIDTSEVLARLPSGRIVGVIGGVGDIRLTLGCACTAEAFLWRPDRLVLDILDPTNPFGREDEAELPDETLNVSSLRPQTVFPLFWGDSQPTSQLVVPTDPFLQAQQDENDLSDLQTAIVAQLGAAMTAGIVDVPVPAGLRDPSADDLSYVNPPDQPADDVLETSVRSGPDVGLATMSPGVRIRTAQDTFQDPNGDSSDDGRTCVRDAVVDVASWARGRDYGDLIPDLRHALVTEMGQYSSEGVEELARGYLHFGFGREALAVLQEDGIMSQEREMLMEIARLVDDLELHGTLLREQIGCDGEVVLWSALALGNLNDASEKGRDTAVLAFQRLPSHLRRHLGPKVAELFMELGEVDTAGLVLRSASMGLDDVGIEAEIAGAAVTEQIGDPETAINSLSTLADRDPRMTSDGLIALMELVVAKGEQVDPAVLELAEALRFELGSTTEAATLARAEALSYIRAGLFGAARRLALDQAIPFTEEGRQEIETLIALGLSAEGEDIEFLEYAFDNPPTDLAPDAEHAISSRLVSLGFPDVALGLLARPVEASDMTERRLHRAEAAVALGDMSLAMEHLEGLSDARSDRIRSIALAQTESPGNLANGASSGPELDTDRGQTPPAGESLALGDTPDTLLRDISQSIREPSPMLSLDATLAERSALLDEAAQTRSLAAELLERFPVDPPTGE